MKSKLRLVYKLSRVIVLFAYGLVLAGLIFPLLGLLSKANIAKKRRDAIKQNWLNSFSAILNLHITQEGTLPEEGSLLVSNHISWLDIVVIGKFLPAYFVAKSDISGWPVIGFLARQAGTIFIRRGDKKHVKEINERMIWLLKQQSNIIAFPEGTTTKGDDVLGFHASLFQPALLTKAPIQPIALEYIGPSKELAPFVGDDDFVSHLLRILTMEKIDLVISFLPVIRSSGRDRLSVSHEARESIVDKIALNVELARVYE